MADKNEATLWRLLGDLESLIEEESFMIKQGSFDDLGKLLEKKETVIQGLVKASQETGINRKTNENFSNRMAKVLFLQGSNSNLLMEGMIEVKRELQKNARAKVKLKGVKGTYGSQSPMHVGLKAEHRV